MIKLKEILLTEKRKNNVIVVDVQPDYEKFIDFSLYNFCNFLNNQNKILYFYNGTETVGTDTKYSISDFLYEYGLNEDKFNEIIWIDKGYAFFRDWMDMGIDDGTMKQVIRFMLLNKANSSDEIPEEKWMEYFPDIMHKIDIEYSSIYLPDIKINKLKTWSGSYLCGGSRLECLKEMQILLSVFNIKYTLVKEFIYG